MRVIYLKVSRLLLLSGASPDTIIDSETKESLISRFSARGNLDMVRMLGIEFGGNTNICDLQVCSLNVAVINLIECDFICI